MNLFKKHTNLLGKTTVFSYNFFNTTLIRKPPHLHYVLSKSFIDASEVSLIKDDYNNTPVNIESKIGRNLLIRHSHY